MYTSLLYIYHNSNTVYLRSSNNIPHPYITTIVVT